MRREEQKVDPLSNELFVKSVYAPEKPKMKEKEGSDKEDEEENEEEGGDEDEIASHDEELDDDLVNTHDMYSGINFIFRLMWRIFNIWHQILLEG